MLKHYKARWGISLITISIVATLVCLGVSLGLRFDRGETMPGMALLPIAVVIACALFTIRGYTLTHDFLLIRRLFWATRLPLGELQSARFEPDAMGWGIRTFGNGGFFSFTGFYHSKTLGSYRAFVTDRHQAVVLKFPAKTIVVSPSAPEEFVHDIGAEIRKS